MKGLCTDLLAFALGLRKTSARRPSNLGTVHRSPGTCLKTEENHRKPQLGDRLMKGLCTDPLAFALRLRKTPETLSEETVGTFPFYSYVRVQQ
jgi:hypothetical protein